MAGLQAHLDLSRTLHDDMKRAKSDGEWPIVIDAGYYAVFHGMEALNALECRDSYTFADAADILENVLARRGLGDNFVDDYRYLFYFRRGALYGCHVPSGAQLAEFVRRAERSVAAIHNMLARQPVSPELLNRMSA
ncbi:MAG: hypothetical protein QOD74_820 [Variibacter sp.]|jgi:hypothetical protein|nr:hypothetical protein [Variibacter sp.]